MKRIMTATIMLLLAVPTLVHAKGAGIEWNILNQEVVELYQQGKYDRAVLVAEKALEVANANLGPAHPEVSTSLNNLAALYKSQGNYTMAEPLHQRALAIWEKALGLDHPDVATSLNNLALFYDTQGNYAKAEPLYQHSLAIREKALGPDHPDVAGSLNNLAALYYTQGTTPRPSRSTSARWPSGKKHWALTIPTWPPA